MSINIGQLNKRISIVRINKTKDPDGYWTESETLVHCAWAKVTEGIGKETVRNNADYSEVTAEFLIRKTTAQLSRKMIVLYGGKRYEIQHIGPYRENPSFIMITAKLLTLEG